MPMPGGMGMPMPGGGGGMPGMPGGMPGGGMMAAKPKKKGPPLPKKVKPDARMRAIFWDKVDPKTWKETVWKDIDAFDVPMNVPLVTQLFRKTLPKVKKKKKKKKTKEQIAAEEAKKAKKKKGKRKATETVLDGKRQQNGGICFARVRLEPEEIRCAIMEMDETVLTEETLGSLASLVPNSEERRDLLAYEASKPDEVKYLTPLDRCLLVLAQFPHIKQRLHSLKLKYMYNGEESAVTVLDGKVDVVLRAIGQIANSTGFQQTLACALKLGNYCNGGTNRGQAWGFKLTSLAKFSQVKSVVNAKVTLLHYLVEMVGDMGGVEAYEWAMDTADIEEGTRIPLDMMLRDFNKINTEVKKIQKEFDFFDAEVRQIAAIHI